MVSKAIKYVITALLFSVVLSIIKQITGMPEQVFMGCAAIIGIVLAYVWRDDFEIH